MRPRLLTKRMIVIRRPTREKSISSTLSWPLSTRFLFVVLEELILHQLQIYTPLPTNFEGRQAPRLHQAIDGRPRETQIHGQLLQRHNVGAGNVLDFRNLAIVGATRMMSCAVAAWLRVSYFGPSLDRSSIADVLNHCPQSDFR